MDLYDELLSLVDLFETNKIDYALCGGIAVAFHGYARFTKDIDILIRTEDLDKILKIVEDREFVFSAGRIPFDLGSPKEREVYRISKIDEEETLTLDLILLNPIFTEVWENREYFDWRDRKVQVVSAEGLAKMKHLAGREQDLLDLKKLGLRDDDKKN